MLSAEKKREVYCEIGKYLAEKRIELGLSQKEVSLKMGYTSPQFVSNYERGLCMPPLKKLKILAELYQIKPKKLADLILEYKKDFIYNEMKIAAKKNR